MKKSKHDERWPTVQRLTKLGWSQGMIAEAIGCSAPTVSNDQRRHSGVAAIAPDRPTSPAARYAATFTYYARTPDIDVHVKMVAEEYLRLEQIKGAEAGINMALDAMCTEFYPEWLEPYMQLLYAVLGSRRQGIDKVPLFDTLLARVRDGDQPAPTSMQEVIEWMAREFALTFNRDSIYLTTPDPERIKETISALLADREILSMRQQSILVMRFGLDGSPPMNLTEVGHQTKLSRERVRQIEARGVRKLRVNKERLAHLLPQGFGSAVEMRDRDLARKDEKIEELQASLNAAKRALSGDMSGLILCADGETPWEGDPAVFNKHVGEWEMTVRSYNWLSNIGIDYVGQLVRCKRAALLRTKGSGRKALNEIIEFLSDEDGLTLGMHVPEHLAAAPHFRLSDEMRQKMCEVGTHLTF